MSLLSDIKKKKQLVGTFVKTPDTIIMEVLALSGLDYVILDAEHAPFGKKELDQCIATCRLAGLSCVVRIENSLPSTILSALDSGATGIQVPHVKNAQQARELVKLCRYGDEGRGFAASTRPALFGNSTISNHLEQSKEPLIIAQIEDIEGVNNLEEIVQVEGITAVFIGRVDLTVAYGETNPSADTILAACLKICKIAGKYDKPIGIFLPNTEQLTWWQENGVSLFAIGSEHMMIIDGFKEITARVHTNQSTIKE
ncbi:aldolase [Vibrio cholerae]|uniref:HpcH/HpaI aldolase family protein n=1 Tax=Vibrio cholerae TaxID=666 RepID=UPI001C9C6C3E|nr:aldolase [Vibrio cholerae]EGR4314273.1 aldolase [Vibrio cholerae]MBY8105085.1 aldolase [Vibrio fluvialis]